jgi:hypothetical protein
MLEAASSLGAPPAVAAPFGFEGERAERPDGWATAHVAATSVATSVDAAPIRRAHGARRDRWHGKRVCDNAFTMGRWCLRMGRTATPFSRRTGRKRYRRA